MNKEPVNAMTCRTLLLLPIALLAACSARKADTTGIAKGVPVRTSLVQARDLPDEIVLTGTLRPRAQVQIVAEVSARLLRLERDEGAHVAKDALLAQLDQTDYRLANDRAQAALAMAQANQAHAVAEKERADSLLKTGGITDRDHLSAKVALQVAEAALAQARAEAAIAAQQLSRTQVRAPFAGRIGERLADPGAMLAAGTPLFTLVDDSVLEFEAQVASRDFNRVKRGAPVELAVDALPGTKLEGRIVRVQPLVDEDSRSFQVVVQLPGRDDLVGGLFARATVRVGLAKDALVVPPAALVRDGSDPSQANLFVVRDGKAERHTITLGVETPDGVQATNEIHAGDAVVLDPPTSLADGAPVAVQNAGGATQQVAQ